MSLALLLTGCQLGDKLASFSAGDAAPTDAPASVCDKFLSPVAASPVTRQTDARVAYTRAADERDEANDRLTVGSFCVRDERKAYAGKGE